MMDRSTAEQNIRARQEAEAICELAGEQPRRFWETLRDLALARLPPVPAPVEHNPPMDHGEAMRFEQVPMPRGMHAGCPVGEIVPSYLLYITEGDKFDQQLRRYVRSQRFAERQDEEDE